MTLDEAMRRAADAIWFVATDEALPSEVVDDVIKSLREDGFVLVPAGALRLALELAHADSYAVQSEYNYMPEHDALSELQRRRIEHLQGFLPEEDEG